MPNKCCVVDCRNPSGFKFPKDQAVLKKWLTAVRRKHWTPTQHSIVCEKHFLPTDFLDGPTANGSLCRKVKRLKKDAVPTVFVWSKTSTVSNLKRDLRAFKRANRHTDCLNVCCVFKCGNTQGYTFPKDKSLFTKWFTAVERKKLPLTMHSIVCEKHFLPTDFLDSPTADGSLSREQPKLKPDAVPSVFTYKVAKKVDHDKGSERLNEHPLQDTNVSLIKDKAADGLKPSADSSVTNKTAACDDLTLKNRESCVLVPAPSLDHDYALNNILVRIPSGYKLFVIKNSDEICKKVLNQDH